MLDVKLNLTASFIEMVPALCAETYPLKSDVVSAVFSLGEQPLSIVIAMAIRVILSFILNGFRIQDVLCFGAIKVLIIADIMVIHHGIIP